MVEGGDLYISYSHHMRGDVRCIFVLLREESWHLGYAIRVLSITIYNGTKVFLRMGANHLKTVELNFPIALLLVVSLKCKGATNGDAQLSGVLVCNSGQVGTFDGKTIR